MAAICAAISSSAAAELIGSNPCVGATQRRTHPIGVVLLVGELAPLDARVALEQRIVAVGAHGDDPSIVVDVDDQGAGGVAHPAEGLPRVGHVVRN